MTCHAVCVTESVCPECVDAAACVDAVLPEGWRRDIRACTGLWPLGVLSNRAHQVDRAEYVPFRYTSGAGIVAALEEQGVEFAQGERLVAAAWWALRLSRRDTTSHAVQRIAERAAAYRVGFLAGQLQPASV